MTSQTAYYSFAVLDGGGQGVRLSWHKRNFHEIVKCKFADKREIQIAQNFAEDKNFKNELHFSRDNDVNFYV